MGIVEGLCGVSRKGGKVICCFGVVLGGYVVFLLMFLRMYECLGKVHL